MNNFCKLETGKSTQHMTVEEVNATQRACEHALSKLKDTEQRAITTMRSVIRKLDAVQ